MAKVSVVFEDNNDGSVSVALVADAMDEEITDAGRMAVVVIEMAQKGEFEPRVADLINRTMTNGQG